MQSLIELLKSVFFGIVEGITEWLPISSTGHLIILEKFIHLNFPTDGFWDFYLVAIQLGAILAVVVLFWNRIFPFSFSKKKEEPFVKTPILILWGKILIACIPAAIVGLLFDDALNALFYNPLTVSIALIVFGILFLAVERVRAEKGLVPRVQRVEDITVRDALLIGCFQLIAAVFPGTSRSGATILGGLLIGLSRTVAAEFTFYLAIPVMFGASLLRLIKGGLAFTGAEWLSLGVGALTAFAVSMVCIRFLMGYIKKHDFRVFGWYRIALGALVLVLGLCGVITQ